MGEGETVVRSVNLPKFLMAVAKFAVTIAAFVIIARYIDLAALVQRLGTVAPLFIAISIAFALLQFPLVGMRWRLIAEMVRPSGETSLPSRKFCQIICISAFFCQFMPFVAGDALRVLYLRDAGASLRVAVKSTVIDRGFGLVVLFVLAPTVLLLSPEVVAGTDGIPKLIAISIAALVVLGIALAAAKPIAGLMGGWRGTEVLGEALLDTSMIIRRPGALSRIILLSVAVHTLSCAVFALLAHGENLGLNIAEVAAVFPLILLASCLPIAIGGWGVREGLTVLLLSRLGVAPEAGLILSLSFGIIMLLASLPGAAFLLLTLTERRHVLLRQLT